MFEAYNVDRDQYNVTRLLPVPIGSNMSAAATGTLEGSTSLPTPEHADNAVDDGVFNEFRNLCLLVTLTTALNDPHSHPTLALATDATMDTLDKHSSVMHALASIFVREHDILACIRGWQPLCSCHKG
jgi:hypothetical protein